jgi:ATP-binding cassette subfamily B multidrug efflux pump
MYGEYGYMEEGELGKPYNLRLLRRLSHYTLPYKTTIATALFLTILISVFDLALPYLSKIAIDRYILASWYKIDMARPEGQSTPAFLRRYGHLMVKATNGNAYFISNTDMKKIDPADLHLYRSRHLLTDERFYKVPRDKSRTISLKEGAGPFFETVHGSVMIPYKRLDRLPKKEILKIREGDINGLALIGMALGVLLVGSFGLGYGEYYLLEFVGQRVMQDIRLTLFKRMQSQALPFFDRHPVGRLVTRVTNDIENLNEMFKSVMITIFKDFLILTGIIGVLLYLNWRLALLCFTLIPFIFGLTFLFSSMARDAFRELRAKVAKINAFLQERLSGMRLIQLFAREAFQMSAFERINQENYLAGMRQIRVFAVFMPIMELFSAFAVALLIWHGGGKVISEQLTLGALVAFISYIQMFFKPIRDISEKYNIMQSAMASTERIFEFMDHREEIPDGKGLHIPLVLKGHLLFENVTFAYESGRPVLRDISFEVRPGETVAVVGPTGSGKTTLVNLIERFYDPNEGAILLDGIDLRDWPKSELRRQTSLVMQDVFIFAGTLKENISLGREGVDSAAIEAAARKANALSFIQRLPGGFEQETGEGGVTLSAGERQLLSFARALAADPKILILDEATSSIDPETERLIQGAIMKIAAKRTTLVVAHRLSTVRHADRILVMHHGRLMEEGTHEQLMALRGIYFKLNMLREA